MSSKRLMPVLPIEAYTSQEWFNKEQELIFSKTWAFAGFIEDLSEPGQYFSVQAGLNNIFIVMGRDRRLRAFHNICRHRGTQLIRAEGKAQKALTCPYHDWTYDLEGNLLSVPNEKEQFPNLDKSCLGLKKASVDVWRGCIWVHPDANVGSIMNWFGEIEPYLGPHRPEELVETEEAYLVEEINANWKIIVENYIDHYHLAQLHSGTLHMYDHPKAEFGFVGPHFAFWEPLIEEYARDVEKKAAMPLIDHIPREQIGAWVPMLFPGIGFGESETNWSTFIVKPIAPDKSIVEIRTKVMNVSDWEFAKQASRSDSFWHSFIRPKYEGDPETDPLATADFVTEDRYVCEHQQKSLQSPYFEHGASAEQGEKPVRDHQQIVLDYIEGRR